jgi:hypothetical protein
MLIKIKKSSEKGAGKKVKNLFLQRKLSRSTVKEQTRKFVFNRNGTVELIMLHHEGKKGSPSHMIIVPKPLLFS